MLRDINHSFEHYEKSYLNEAKWLKLLEIQINEYECSQTRQKQQRAELRRKYGEQQNQQQSTLKNMDDEINELKNSLDPVAVNIRRK